MDFKQFYLSAQGRVNRKQWWLKLILPIFVISIILGFVDMATGLYDPQAVSACSAGFSRCWRSSRLSLGFLPGTPGPNRFAPPPSD
jgi:uncharacterized membrane protein YhaH (DUF805 family)